MLSGMAHTETVIDSLEDAKDYTAFGAAVELASLF